MKQDHCPYCNDELDCATSARNDGAVPSEGDYSVCFSCGGLMVFGKDLKLEKMSHDEFSGLSQGDMDLLLRMQKKISERARS